MPLYFRKRPGSKNFKANITQRGLSSFTLTTGGKKGQLRFNLNSKRGFSFSIPGTGLVWRQKGYGKSQYKSAVEERGYDLRTKEGKEQHAKKMFEQKSNLACVIVGVGATEYYDSPHGLWAAYLLFWVLFAIGEKSVLTFIWAVFAHIGAAVGYALSFTFSTQPIELIIWGFWLASFLFSVIFKKFGEFLIALLSFIGIWALLDEPSSYFQKIPSRLGFDNFVASIPDLTLLNSVLNVYGLVSLIFGIFYYLKINSSLINLWNSSKIKKFLAKITHFFLFLIILLPLSCSLYPFAFYLMGAEPEKISISTYPTIFFMALGYSLTFGLLVNRAIINMRYHNTSLQTSFVQCLSSLFWLPLFGKDFSAEKQIEDGNSNSNKISITSQTEQTSQINNLSEVDYIQVLENVWGLGEKKVHALLKAYPTAQLFLADTDEQVSSKTKSLIGKNTARKIRLNLIESDSVR